MASSPEWPKGPATSESVRDELSSCEEDRGTTRLLQSCDLCRKRKIKCDGTKPRCDQCQKRRIECHYSVTTVRRKQRKTYVKSLEDRVAAMESRFEPLLAQLARMNDLLATTSLTEQQPPSTSQPTESPGKGESSVSQSPTPTLLATPTPSLSPPVVAAGISSVDSCPKLTLPQRPTTSATAEAHIALQPVSPIVYPFKPQTALSPSWTSASSASSASSPLNADDLTLVHSPLLSQTLRHEALASYNKFFLMHSYRMTSARFPDLFYPEKAPEYFILAMCALGCRFSDNPQLRRNPPFLSGHEFAMAVEKQIGTILAESSPYGVMALMCLALYAVGRGEYQKIWPYAGMASRMAHQLRLHQIDNPDRMSGVHDDADELVLIAKRQLFWMCFVMDKVSASSCSLPDMFNDKDCMVMLPPLSPLISLPHFILDMANAQPSLATLFTAADASHYFLRVIGLHGQVSNFANRRWQAGAADAETSFRLGAALDNFFQTLPRALRYDPNRLPEALTDEDRMLLAVMLQLHITYYAAVIVLHRSHLSRSGRIALPDTNVQAMSRQKCLESARVTASILQTIMKHGITRYLEPLTGVLSSHSALVFANCVLDPDPALRAETVRVVPLFEDFMADFGQYWGINQVWTMFMRGVMCEMIKAVDPTTLGMDKGVLALLSPQLIADRCLAVPFSNDDWIVPDNSHYTADPRLVTMKEGAASIKSMALTKPVQPRPIDRDLLLPFLDANNRNTQLFTEPSIFAPPPQLPQHQPRKRACPDKSPMVTIPTSLLPLGNVSRATTAPHLASGSLFPPLDALNGSELFTTSMDMDTAAHHHATASLPGTVPLVAPTFPFTSPWPLADPSSLSIWMNWLKPSLETPSFANGSMAQTATESTKPTPYSAATNGHGQPLADLAQTQASMSVDSHVAPAPTPQTTMPSLSMAQPPLTTPFYSVSAVPTISAPPTGGTSESHSVSSQGNGSLPANAELNALWDQMAASMGYSRNHRSV
ncbi:hypothetical protein H4R34_005084 [Dimargaris verticillata]|uniref:Zn(2)-C6 fungal-type domain-containing protein n=1 Tax=Dimargaris verticillata TaxID=2761393 RepID=A0A9W8E6J4_9FUNG|nr:hypothetical protein H4R34_005084 [Dimargaris verticillata]